jgi:hypothetical protein
LHTGRGSALLVVYRHTKNWLTRGLFVVEDVELLSWSGAVRPDCNDNEETVAVAVGELLMGKGRKKRVRSEKLAEAERRGYLK